MVIAKIRNFLRYLFQRRGDRMTKNLAREVRKDVDDQMQAIDNLINAIHTLHKQAESTNDLLLPLKYRTRAPQLSAS